MRIAIDAVGNVSGGGLSVLYRTMRELGDDDRVDEAVVYGSPAAVLSERIPAVDGVAWVPRQTEHASLRERLRWYDERLSQTAEAFGADVVIAMNGMGRTRRPRIAVIQQAFSVTSDLSLLQPWTFRVRQEFIRRQTVAAARAADRIVVPSAWLADASKHRLARRPDVIPLGLPRAAEPQQTIGRRRVVIDTRPLDYKRSEVARTVGRMARSRAPNLEVCELDGSVGAATVAEWFGEGVAYVSASRIESFGLGVAEAFAHGCPVIVADRAWSRSIGGDAALYFTPDDAAGAAEHVVMLASDDNYLEDAVARGQNRLEALWRPSPYRQLVDICAEVAR